MTKDLSIWPASLDCIKENMIISDTVSSDIMTFNAQ